MITSKSPTSFELPLLQTDLAKVLLPIVVANLVTLDHKQLDYGSQNLTKFGTFGVVVRASDKIERIVNLIKRFEGLQEGSGTNPLNEPLSDSFLDLSNYALIAYVMYTRKWPIAISSVAP